MSLMSSVPGKLTTCMCTALLTATLAGAAAADEGDAVAFEAVYTGEVWENVSGGLARKGTYLNNIDLTLEADMDAVAGWSDTTVFLYGLYNNGNTFSENIVGDAQTVSNIDAPRAFRLYEAWVERGFWDGRASLKLGLYDLNSEFDAKDGSDVFIGSSHGIGPDFSQSGENGPSIFPSTSLAARLQVALSDSLTARMAVLDAVPNDPDHPARTVIRLGHGEGALVAAELDWRCERIGRIAAGTWIYSAKTDVLEAGAPQRRNKGGYAFWEKEIWQGTDAGSVALFARFGKADAQVNQFSASYQLGANATGLFPGRPDDIAGIALSTARNSRAFRAEQALLGESAAKSETAIEFTYHMPINDWLAVQPDVQYTVHPGGFESVSDALSVGLRFEIAFGL